jgi:hypothetical protein
MGKVLAVCISEKKGTEKKNVGSAKLLKTGASKTIPTPASGTARFRS